MAISFKTEYTQRVLEDRIRYEQEMMRTHQERLMHNPYSQLGIQSAIGESVPKKDKRLLLCN